MLAASQSKVPMRSEVDDSMFSLETLIHRVGQAVKTEGPSGVCQVLSRAISHHHGFLPAEFRIPNPNRYARREIYSDPDGCFSILAMVWGPGQGTLLHDHGGLWVVECVYEGQIKVCNYNHLGSSRGVHRFVAGRETFDGPGAADQRVPPHEHHMISNARDLPSVTLHVFGGILSQCRVFEPVKGGYRESLKTMSFD